MSISFEELPSHDDCNITYKYESSSSFYQKPAPSNSTQGKTTVSEKSLNEWLFSANRKLNIIENLGDGWSGNDSLAVDKKILKEVRKLLIRIGRTPNLRVPIIIPAVDGSLQLEWKNRAKELEIQFFPNGSVDYLFCENLIPKEEGELSIDDIPKILSLIVNE